MPKKKAKKQAAATTISPTSTREIDGLKFIMSSDEVASHCFSRAKYHRTKAEEAEQRIPVLEQLHESIEQGLELTSAQISEVSKLSNYSSGRDLKSSLDTFKNEVKVRKRRALSFEFLGAHVLDGNYVLSQRELQELEITPANERW